MNLATNPWPILGVLLLLGVAAGIGVRWVLEEQRALRTGGRRAQQRVRERWRRPLIQFVLLALMAALVVGIVWGALGHGE